ncbi:PadR family transcriptional regulator [Clostridium sp.]|uniref:PadR family transcriptional regulator n=1 Tax=Clostridium sp. TaxID=1506 RepID=UPI003D6CF1B9
MNVDKELLKGSIPIMVLKLFTNEDMYGYQIIKKLELLSSGVFSFKEGTLYPILHSLEKLLYVESYWQQSEVGRKRKYYRITKLGQSYFNEKVEEWRGFTSAVNIILEGGNEDGEK